MASWRNDLEGDRLLVSGFGKWGGGVYDLTSGTPHAYDDLPTSGLSIGGDRVWRVLRAPGEHTASCELLSYDRRGMRSYQRLDAIRDPHDVCWHDGAVHISSSWDAAVWRVEPDDTLRAVWRGGAVPDSWHVNSLVVVDGRLHVCAFGRYDAYKGWKGDDEKAAGFVHDTVRGVDVLGGLSHPHSPRQVGDRWYVCESTKGALAEYDDTGKLLRRARIRRFSRGLAIVGGWAFIGGNAHRQEEGDRAEIAVIDLESFEIVDRIPMPCLEVYDIVQVPFLLARGVALGFGANPSRAVEQYRGQTRPVEQRPTSEEANVHLVNSTVAGKVAAAGQPLRREVADKFRVRADLPTEMHAGEVRIVPVEVQNNSPMPAATVPPNPIRLGARWYLGRDAKPIRNPMSPLPELLHAGDAATTEIVLAAPATPGRYKVRVTLHQPTFGWFGRRTEAEITVVPADGADGADGADHDAHHDADVVAVAPAAEVPGDESLKLAGR
jgi:hypothetical protein